MITATSIPGYTCMRRGQQERSTHTKPQHTYDVANRYQQLCVFDVEASLIVCFCGRAATKTHKLIILVSCRTPLAPHTHAFKHLHQPPGLQGRLPGALAAGAGLCNMPPQQQ